LENLSSEISNFGIKTSDFTVNSGFEFVIGGKSLVFGSSLNGESVFEVFFDVIEDSEDGVDHCGVTLDWGSLSDGSKNFEDFSVSMRNTLVG